MWPTLLSLCLVLSGKSARKAPPRRRPAFRRPLLEVLEDRALPSAYVVTTTADSGPGSLRDAINQINADTSHALYASPSNPSVDEIDFAITAASDTGGGYDPATGVATITPQGGMPNFTIVNPIVIDGYTQLGASLNTLAQGDNAVLKVQIDMSHFSPGGYGLILRGDGSTVRGLVLNDVTAGSWALSLAGKGEQASGNFIGTDVSGTNIVGGATQFASGGGIDVPWFSAASPGDLIGGTAPAARNIISGFSTGVSASGLVEGNYIGTDASGTKALGNQVGVSASGMIGGTAPGAGNLISGNQTAGITGHNLLIQGNLIGTDATGTSALGNDNGIFLYGVSGDNDSVLIGGTTAAARNIISGNTDVGISTTAGTAGGVVIEGNYIGTDITGTKAVAGDGDGIWLESNGTVGGTSPGAGNVISGNGDGIRGFGSNTVIEGNLIGTDYTGTKAIGNGIGINFQDGGSNNVIGGLDTNAPGAPLAGGGNVISGNYTGIYMSDAYSTPSGNIVEGNYIGTDITGMTAIGSGLYGAGVSLNNGADNTIGGTTAASRNVISGNPGNGISLSGGTGNVIEGNSIYDSGDLGIDLANGANNNQAAPVLTAAYAASGATIVTGTMTSTPNATVRVEFFANAAGDPEGRTLLGTQSVTTDASGHGSFAAFLSALPAGQALVTATATDPNGNTSEFSAGVTATPLPPSTLSGVVWEDFNDDGQVDFGENGISGVTVTLTGTDFLGNPVNLSQTTDGGGAYAFPNLYPGNYSLTETPPSGYTQGIDSVGTAGGSLSGTDQFSVALGVGINGLNYNFGEQPPAGSGVKHGQTAGIGFWNNKQGQALIKALNGGTGTQLADWLAATLPNTFGKNAGSNDVAGQSNASIAALFQQDFVQKGVKLDAQLLATALSVYSTNATLDPTKMAASYGFTVSGDGAGTATVNVGSNGDAFGVANNTTMTLMDLLLAADAQAVNGVLYGGNATRRNEANAVFSAVNQAGGI